jgi:uncharacterized membrane protein YjgN (DUF898 family)
MNDVTTGSILPAGAPAGEPIRIDYVPRDGLLKLTIVNFLLGVVTLTIYRFWAKTNVRRHIWSCVHINGEPLEYTGKGMELFKGALIVFAIFGLPVIIAISAINLIYGPEHPAIFGVQMLLFLIIAVLWGAAIYRARRYQLSRTLWRGIRGTLQGSSMTYSLMYFGAMLARSITLGWSTPVMNLNLQEQMTGDMRFGSMAFKFKGRAGPLYPTYAVCWFLALVAIVVALAGIGFLIGSLFGDDLARIFGSPSPGKNPPDEETVLAMVLAPLGLAFLLALGLYPIIWSFYTAKELKVFADYTTADRAQFRLDATAWSIIKLAVGNLLLWIFTLGIARPFIQQRLVRYLCDRVTVEGTIDINSIAQSTDTLYKTGEGLADALDVGGL